ncbi:4'-phosphopantetheinyl transferase superfamily protein [uncultured Gilvimarinus sp.]|uniref:4'-phosphopantetheinyl transferase family protein n=1 Tax=uncultured Gilvimarinus sp. TaxID=1689143 RepID=UPI0030DA48E8
MPTNVWLCPADLLTANMPQTTLWLKRLCDTERARMQRYRTERQKYGFLSARALLRTILATYCHQKPGQLRFTTNRAGKPKLEHPHAPHFSLSHSGHWIALAVAPEGAIGIDLEHPRKPRNVMAIARHYYHPSEHQRLSTLDEPARSREFYRLWTLKEAFFKARGTGISEGLNRVRIAPEGQQPPAYFDFEPEFARKTGRNTLPRQLYYHHEPMGIEGLHMALARAGQPLCPQITLFSHNQLAE